MKGRLFHKKLWLNIFALLTVVFALFVTVLTVSNTLFLDRCFVVREKYLMRQSIEGFASLDIDDVEGATQALTHITESTDYDIEIYTSDNSVIYAARGSRILGRNAIKLSGFHSMHENMKVKKTRQMKDGVIFETSVKSSNNKEYLVCKKEIDKGVFVQLSVQLSLISDYADAANDFIVAISLICFIGAVIWGFIFARKFAKPISEMNEITGDMAKLNFERKIENKRIDEIGQLADSINELSDSLSYALADLKETNIQLQKDIELERQLDTMRKTFIANVSHELKTPISIINGYAEGLKLNTNPENRDEYCDIIIDEGKRMSRLVTEIMWISKYESGQITLSEEIFDISIIAQRIMERIFIGSAHTYECLIEPNTVIKADVSQTEHILGCLLANAHSHSKSDSHIKVFGELHGNVLRICVHNTESHIDEGIIQDIWQSFYRGDASHKRDESHFGLGLSIVSAAMKSQGLSCGAYNTEDGVCVWFEAKLPPPRK